MNEQQLDEFKEMMDYNEVEACVSTIVENVQHMYGKTPISHTSDMIIIYGDNENYTYPMIDGALTMFNYLNGTHISFNEKDIHSTRTIRIFSFKQVK